MNHLLKNLYKRLMESTDEGGDPGAAAPAATPQEPSAPVEPAGADDGVDWANLSDDSEEAAVTDGWEEAPTTAQQATPENPAAAQPALQAAEQSATPTEPPAVQPEQVATEPQQPEQPQQPTTIIPEQRQAAENAYMAQLEGLYKFDEATALAVQTEPEKVLPALAARLHLDVMKTVMTQVQAMMPQMLQTHSAANARNAEAQDKFFSAWPELKGHSEQVLKVGQMFRQLNPNASADDAVRIIGETTMAALGMRRAAAVEPPPPASNVPAFAPAAPGRASAPPPTPTTWDDMIEPD